MLEINYYTIIIISGIALLLYLHVNQERSDKRFLYSVIESLRFGNEKSAKKYLHKYLDCKVKEIKNLSPEELKQKINEK